MGSNMLALCGSGVEDWRQKCAVEFSEFNPETISDPPNLSDKPVKLGLRWQPPSGAYSSCPRPTNGFPSQSNSCETSRRSVANVIY